MVIGPKGETMTTAVMVTYAYHQIDWARVELDSMVQIGAGAPVANHDQHEGNTDMRKTLIAAAALRRFIMSVRTATGAAAVLLGAACGAAVLSAPQAAAGPVFLPCGTYLFPRIAQPYELIVRQGDGVSCEQARAMMDDWAGGKGTPNGYQCVINSVKEEYQSKTNRYCTSNSAYFALRIA